MASQNELNVVLGATGGAGNAVVRELVRQGKRVRAVSRSAKGNIPAGVEIMRGDITKIEDAKAVCKGATVIYNCANVDYPQWLALFPSMIEGAIVGAASSNAKMVFADNLYMYGKVNGPMTEAMPYNPVGKKGQLRAKLANRLMDAHKAGDIRLTIGRASDFYGPFADSAAGSFLFAPVLEGKKASWIGSLDAPHTMTYLDDFARGLITLGENDAALGEAWHIPSGDPVTGRQFLQTAFEVAGQKPNIGLFNRLIMTAVSPFMSIARESLEVLYQFEAPFVMDTSKFTRTFGAAHTTPLREGLEKTIAWYREQVPQSAVLANA